MLAKIVDFLRSQAIARTLDASQVELLAQLLEVEHVAAAEVVVEEGQVSRDLYFLLEGEVSLWKWDEKRQCQFCVGTLSRGELFGEMSFFEDQPRTVTIRTTLPAILLKLPYSCMQIEDPEIEGLFYNLLSSIAFLNGARLRQTNIDYVESLQERVKQLELQNRFGHFCLLLILMMGCGIVLNAVTVVYKLDWNSPFYNWGYLMLLLIPSMILMRPLGLSLGDVGVTLKNGRKALVEGLVISLISLVLLGLGYELYLLFHPGVPTLLDRLSHPLMEANFFYVYSLYLVSAYLQELLTRGFIQSSLARFWSGLPYGDWKAVLMVAFLFGLNHFQRGIGSTVVVFFASLLFGALYVRHQNLLGVTLIHYVWGILGITYLGIV